MSRCQFFATAPKNLETLLAEELRGIGMENARETRGGATFSATLADAYKVCIWSRVASRILMVISRFPAASPEELYAGARAVDWNSHFTLSQTFAVDCHTAQSAISHSRFGALKVKDAIVDQFREKTGVRPSVRTENPDIRLNLYLFRDQATLSLDLSGESLHRRGYRGEKVAAPLKENLAAAILLRAGWPEIAADGGSLVDPMCGSGTLPIEAAMIAANIAPGLIREHWGFSGWRGHDPAAWQAIASEAEKRRKAGISRLPDIRGYDHNPAAVRAAIANVNNAGLAGLVHIERRELAESYPGRPEDRGLVVVNPPYGERLENDTDLLPLYARLGESLKKNFQHWQAAVFTGRPDMGHAIGLRAKRIHTLYNGGLACKLLHFDIQPESFLSPGRGPRPLPAAARGSGAEMFANRLRKNLKKLEKWRKREKIDCYRVYDADLPEYNSAIDLYRGEELWVNVQEYEAPATVDRNKAKRRLRETLGVIIDLLEIPQENLFIKVRRPQKGKSQYEKLADKGEFRQVMESGCRFLVNFSDYLDTGIFLDHRLTRKKIAALAAGRDFLNLFAYTGTATVCAACGGARSTTSVEMSNTYLDWARRNMALNDFKGREHRFIRADCLKWLEEEPEKNRYGLIFLDPPSFSASKKMRKGKTLDIQRDHPDLIRRAARLLTPDGIMIFSTNLRSFRMATDRLTGLTVKNISRATIPLDFSNNPRIHQCWEIRKAKRK